MRWAVSLLSAALLMACSGERATQTPDPAQTAILEPASAKAGKPDRSARLNAAELDYALNCQGCHLAQGTGTEGKVPRMQGFVSKFLHSKEGRDYVTRVPGVTNAALSDADLARLMTYVVTTQDPKNLPKNFVPFTEAEIAVGRANGLANRASAVRKALIAKHRL